MNGKLMAALKKGGTVQQLMKAAKMSRGGVIQALRRNKKLIKKKGTKREHERGPESTIYALRAGAKVKARAKKPTPAQYRAALDSLLKDAASPTFEEGPPLVPENVDANGSPVPSEALPATEAAPAAEPAGELASIGVVVGQAAVEAGEKMPDEA